MAGADGNNQGQTVQVTVPADHACYAVFRQQRGDPFRAEPSQDVRFVFCAGPLALIPVLLPVARGLGLAAALEAVAKLLTGKRKFYCVTQGGRLAHFGWCNVSFCRCYPVRDGDVAIGPIRTMTGFEGRGLATLALQGAMDAMMARGHSVFFIDTATTNHPCLRVIEKSEFGPPVAAYVVYRPQVEKKA